MLQRMLSLSGAGVLWTSGVLLFLSLGSLSFPSLALIHCLLGPGLVIVFIVRCSRGRFGDMDPTLVWFFLLFLWLVIQQAGIWLHVPFFTVPSSWRNWVEIFPLLLAGAGFYLMTSEILDARGRLATFIRFWVAGFALLGVYFIGLYYTSGVNVESLKPPFPVLENLGHWAGTGFQPNNLVDLFIPPFFFAVSVVLYRQKRKLDSDHLTHVFMEIILFLCAACILLAAILFTRSRAGILSFGLGLMFYFFFFSFLHRRRLPALLKAGVVMAVVVAFLLTLGVREIFEELKTVFVTVEEEFQLKGVRSLTIGATWQMITKAGLFGVGLGNLQMGWVLLHEAPFLMMPLRSYNDFLWFWAEAGFPGFFLFTGLFLWYTVSSVILAMRTSSYFIAYLLLSAGASVVAFSAHALVDPTFYCPALLFSLMISMGIGSAARNLEFRETREDTSLPARGPKRNALMFFLIMALAVANSGFYFQKGRALVILEKSPADEQALIAAARMDFVNPTYPYRLSQIHLERFREAPTPEGWMRVLDWLDEAIRRDPLELMHYKTRAAASLEAGDKGEMSASFSLLAEMLPDFYMAELVAAAFYMEASEEAVSETLGDDFSVLALRHYMKALDLNPGLSKEGDLYPWMSRGAREKFVTLLREKMV